MVEPGRYDWLLTQIAAGGIRLADRRSLAAAAFRHTATYDVAVASWLGSVIAPDTETPFPVWVGATWERKDVLRYGENPHQAAALYTGAGGSGVAVAQQLHGKEMSYNNYVDADAAWRATLPRLQCGARRALSSASAKPNRTAADGSGIGAESRRTTLSSEKCPQYSMMQAPVSPNW